MSQVFISELFCACASKSVQLKSKFIQLSFKSVELATGVVVLSVEVVELSVVMPGMISVPLVKVLLSVDVEFPPEVELSVEPEPDPVEAEQ